MEESKYKTYKTQETQKYRNTETHMKEKHRDYTQKYRNTKHRKQKQTNLNGEMQKYVDVLHVNNRDEVLSWKKK